MDLKLAQRVAIVTGGSSGIGLATVRLLLEEGARVVACARNLERLQQAAAQMHEAGFGADRLFVQSCDVLDENALQRLSEAARVHFGGVDILVANAGQGRVSTFATTLDTDWEAELALKFFSVVRPVRTLLPLLQQSDAASIVIVNSLLAKQPEPHMVCTSAARAGVHNLAKSLSMELAPRIRVNSVLLGMVDSGQWERRFVERARPGQSRDEWLDELAREKHIPLRRLGRPEEAAAAIAFLASSQSGFITGAALEVAGGVSRFA